MLFFVYDKEAQKEISCRVSARKKCWRRYMIRFKGQLWACLAMLFVVCGCGGGENATKLAEQDAKTLAAVSEQAKSQQAGDIKGQQSSALDTANDSVESSKDEEAASAVAKPNDQGVDSISLSAKGESPWSLKASRIDYDDVSKKARASSITWNLLDKGGRSLLQLQGDAAVVNTETQSLAFEGPVHAVGPKGEKIVCNKLIWDSKARKLRGSHGVKVVREGSTMVGQNMVASPDLKHVEVEGDVRVYFSSGLESN